MALQLKSLKGTSGQGSSTDSRVELLDSRACDMIKRHNALRAQALQKEKELALLAKKLDEVEDQAQGTVTADSLVDQQLRDLESKLDRANIKHQEAQHMSQLYQALITKLEAERLSFNNSAEAMELVAAGQEKQLTELEAMNADAQHARETARNELNQLEAEANATKKEREAAKSHLYLLAEERRRQQEVSERRMRLKSANSQQSNPDDGNDNEFCGEDTQWKLNSYEQALGRIQTVTGVIDIDNVVERFAAQGQSQQHLTQLQNEVSEKLAELRRIHARVLKQHEAQQYSGEARASSNQRMLHEFQRYLREAQARAEMLASDEKRLSKKVVALKVGVDHINDKVSKLEPVGQPHPTTASDKLHEAGLRLQALLQDIEQQKEALDDTDLSVPVVLPEHNTRVPLEHSYDIR